VLGVPLATGLGLHGYRMGVGVGCLRSSERLVTVKGLAERVMPAKLSICPLVFNTTGNDLAELHARLDRDSETITRFLQCRSAASRRASSSAPHRGSSTTSPREGTRTTHRQTATGSRAR